MTEVGESMQVAEQRSSSISCFIPGGNWKPTHIPIYNPTDQFRKARLVIGDPSGQVSVTEVPISARSVNSIDGTYGYALVDEVA